MIYCHGYTANLLGLTVACRLGIPVVSVSRGWTAERQRVRICEWLDRLVLSRMDKVLSISEGRARYVCQAGVADEKIIMVPSTVHPVRFDSLDETYRDHLRQILASDEGYREEGNRYILPERPDGCYAQKPPILPCALGFIVGSAGRLIAATAVGGNVGRIGNGLASLLPPPKRPTAGTAAVKRWLRETELARRTAAAAWARVETSHSHPLAVVRLEGCYHGRTDSKGRL